MDLLVNLQWEVMYLSGSLDGSKLTVIAMFLRGGQSSDSLFHTLLYTAYGQYQYGSCKEDAAENPDPYSVSGVQRNRCQRS